MAKHLRNRRDRAPNRQQRTIIYRIYPNEEQERQIIRTFGCCRFYWNHALNDEKQHYAETGSFFINTPARYKEPYPFLREVDSLALAHEQLRLRAAFNRFFESKRDADLPQFKKKKRGFDAYTTSCQPSGTKTTVQLVYGGIKLPKLGVVKAAIHRQPMPGWKLKTVLIRRAASGRYYCSLLYGLQTASPRPVPLTEEHTVGLSSSDRHLFLEDSGAFPAADGNILASRERHRRLARQLSRMTEGSRNYREQLGKIRRLEERMRFQRLDQIHRQSRRIANACSAVCMEKADPGGGGTPSWTWQARQWYGLFQQHLHYKLAEQGKLLILVDASAPGKPGVRLDAAQIRQTGLESFRARLDGSAAG